MSFNLVGFGFDMAMFGAGLAIGAFVTLNRKPRTRVIPPELLPVDVVCTPEPRRLETRGSSPSRRVSEYAPKSALKLLLETKVKAGESPFTQPIHRRFAAQSTAPSRHHKWTAVPEAAAPPPQPRPPQHDEAAVAARNLLPVNNWRPT